MKVVKLIVVVSLYLQSYYSFSFERKVQGREVLYSKDFLEKHNKREIKKGIKREVRRIITSANLTKDYRKSRNQKKLDSSKENFQKGLGKISKKIRSALREKLESVKKNQDKRKIEFSKIKNKLSEKKGKREEGKSFN